MMYRIIQRHEGDYELQQDAGLSCIGLGFQHWQTLIRGTLDECRERVKIISMNCPLYRIVDEYYS